MLTAKDAPKAILGLAEKSVGLTLETLGTIGGNDRLREAGRYRQEAGSERLMRIQEETKATAQAARAEGFEREQKARQAPNKRGEGRDFRDQGSAGSAVAEKAKGSIKQAAGAVAGSDDMRREGRAQQDKAGAAGRAAEHEAKAQVHGKKADAKRRASERLRKS